MAQLGVNVDGRGLVAPAELAASGAGWVRCVALSVVDLRGWIGELRALGIGVLLVLARESFAGFATLEAGLLAYRARYGDLVWWQIGNEPDQQGEASWTMDRRAYNGLVGLARVALGVDAVLIGAGLASGDPGWLAGQGATLELLDAIGVHPYAKEPGTKQLDDLLAGYAGYGKPLWATEYHARTRGMAEALRDDRRVARAAAFCWTDEMVEGFGLQEDEEARAEYAVATQAGLARAVDVSNYQGDIRPRLGEWIARGVEHVVVRLGSETAEHERLAVEQLRAAASAGLSCAGYLWCYWAEDPLSQVRAVLELARAAGVSLTAVWLDAEAHGQPGEGPAPVTPEAGLYWLRRARWEVERQGQRPGIYTGAWFWNGYLGGGRDLAELPLWYAHYDAVPSLQTWRAGQAFGGWKAPAGKQYEVEAGLDWNVFERAAIRAAVEPAPEPQYHVGPGIRRLLERRGWVALSDEQYVSDQASEVLVDRGPEQGGVGLVRWFGTTRQAYLQELLPLEAEGG